ncbi:antibiotic biosynthesis monooxygenase family protein [Dactylosporangium sp. CA-092794]|uniref:antibiotic biosynthesis monooxygenase family protein n=1 Tax=Dactylosporangium sp. CA-092794 TaxID=3239929 RepID=UPI003D9152C7
MLVMTRFVIDDTADAADEFAGRAHAALAALAACPGYLRGRLARAYDDPAHWSIVTEWESVGAYRRALSAFDVKVHATPLLAQSLDEPSAFEVLAESAPGGELKVTTSDRA